MKKIAIMTAAVFLVLSCGRSDKSRSMAAVERSGDVVETGVRDTAAQVELDAVSGATAVANPVTFNGTLVIPPDRFATVSLSMGGIVKEMNMMPGKYVRRGERLAVLENPEFVDLQQEFLDSRAQLEYLGQEYRRQENLSREQAASQKKLQQSKADYLSMHSRMQACAVQLRQLGVEPDSLTADGIRPGIVVTAPVDGYVSNVQAALGKHLGAGEPLCNVIDKSSIMVRLVAYEKDLAHLEQGDRLKVRVNGLGSREFHGSIVSVGQQVDERNRSVEVYVAVSDPDPVFRPGMYVTAMLEK